MRCKINLKSSTSQLQLSKAQISANIKNNQFQEQGMEAAAEMNLLEC